MSTRDVAERCEMVPLIGPTGGRDGNLVSVGVKLLDLGEQRRDELHRLVMARDEVLKIREDEHDHYTSAYLTYLIGSSNLVSQKPTRCSPRAVLSSSHNNIEITHELPTRLLIIRTSS